LITLDVLYQIVCNPLFVVVDTPIVEGGRIWTLDVFIGNTRRC